jgi:hypothetical protein
VKHFFKYLIFYTAFAIVSCDSSDEGPSIERGTAYFPLRVGQYQIYDVDETRYTLGAPETFTYELKTLVSDSFPNSAGGFTYVIQRSKRDAGSTEFVPLDTWAAREEEGGIVVQEQNKSFVKIRLPIAANLEWDGNVYNTDGEDLYLMEEVGTSYSIDGQTFDDCIIINQHNNEDFVVFLDQRKEVYAKHTGLIERQSTLLTYCTVGDCLGQQQVESGVVYRQTIKSHGVE